ncbi:hypothetical protein MSG28_001378 [Choristoneura fumiferana]|uniref:Uncharacterized protein n=1 Tax=Choristoneura fumiferana TaxID=7141 RepID=A0ACC0KTY7_CHOFU|nr:hypothetical protein MSG28_001378 [Choristoneura fumiferana]
MEGRQYQMPQTVPRSGLSPPSASQGERAVPASPVDLHHLLRFLGAASPPEPMLHSPSSHTKPPPPYPEDNNFLERLYDFEGYPTPSPSSDEGSIPTVALHPPSPYSSLSYNSPLVYIKEEPNRLSVPEFASPYPLSPSGSCASYGSSQTYYSSPVPQHEEYIDIEELLKENQILQESIQTNYITPKIEIEEPRDHVLLRSALEDTSFQKRLNLRPIPLELATVKMEESSGGTGSEETLVNPDIDRVLSMAIEQSKRDVDDTCSVLGISPDPMLWNTENVKSWVMFTLQTFNLPMVPTEYFAMDGAALMALTEEDFVQRAPQLEIWKAARHEVWRPTAWSEPQPSPAPAQAPPTAGGKAKTGSTHIHLWQFLKELLASPHVHGSAIRWLDRSTGVFKIEDSVRVAKLWGKRKNRPAMNYDKLSRSIRQYYKKGIMKKTERSQRLIEANDVENNNGSTKDHHKSRKTRRKARDERQDGNANSDVNPKAWSNCAYACHGVLGGVSLMHLLLISYSDSLDAGHLSFHAVVTMPYVATYFFLCVLCLISVLDSRGLQPYFQPIVLVILYCACLLVCCAARMYDELMVYQYAPLVIKVQQIGINKIRKMTTHILNSTQSVIQEYYDYYLWTLSLSAIAASKIDFNSIYTLKENITFQDTRNILKVVIELHIKENRFIADAVWWYYFSKLLEFCDTFFFILRKKDEQLTFLHIQFTCALVLGINGIRMGCEFPLWMHYVLIFYMISFIVLFGNFYMKAYLAKGDEKYKNVKMRPPARKGHPVMVEFSIYVVDVNSINVEDMDFRVDMFIRQTWSESRLQLPEDIFEEGDDHVTLPPEFFDNLWHPDPYFLNSKVTGTGPLDGRLYDVCIRSTRGVRGGKGAGQTVPMNKNKAQESMPRIIPVKNIYKRALFFAFNFCLDLNLVYKQLLNTVIFAMEGIGVVMPVENEMAKPQQFLGCPGVLNVAMTIVISLYGTVGFFGYIKYGDDVRGSVTLNLPQDEILAQTAKILMALAILFTYSLQFYVPMEMIWRQIHDKISVRYHEITQISIRTIAVVSSDAVENNIYNENSLDDADSELGGGITNDVENKKSNRDDINKIPVVSDPDINIYFAEYNINTISDCVGGTCIETVMMHPDKIIVHEDFGYKLDGLFNDIALMRLRESTPYTGDDVTKFVRGVEETLSGVSEEYGGPKWSVTAFCGLTLVVLVPLCQINKLKYLVPFSAIANFVWVGAIGISIYYCVRDPPKVTERNLATSITGIPNFISTSLFAMEGIGVVMPIENEMIKPAQFLGCPGVLNIAMVTVSLLYACVGFAGYLQYGDEVRGSLTLNLPQDEILAQSAKIMVACVMLLTFALIFYVPFDVVWRHLKHRVPARNHGWAVAGIRLVGTLLIVGIATAVPRLELFMELIGAILLSVMGLMLPAITETVFRWGKDLGPVYCVVFKNTIIVLFSLIAMVSGVVYSLKTMLEKL